MSDVTNKSTVRYWIGFIVWLILLIVLLCSYEHRHWFWLTLPGVFTNFVFLMKIV